MQKIKNNPLGNSENIKPYIVVGVGVLVIAVSVYQLLAGAPGNLFQSRADKQAAQEASKPGSTKENQQNIVVDNIDSDSDGLTDTEEERIYHTDPLKPDTDGDSFRDGDEVKTGHDPLVNESGKSSGNSSSSSSTTASSQEYNRFIASTPDDLSKLDPTQYLDESTLQDLASGSPSQQSIEKISSLALANTAISETQPLPEIANSELNITSASGKQAVQQYIFSLASVLVPLAPFSSSDQMMSYLLAAAQGDTTKVQTLVSAAKVAEKQLKSVPVPNELVDTHKKIIGVIQTFGESASVLLNANTVDSTTGLKATNQLRIITNAAQDLAKTLQDVLKKYNLLNLPV